MFAPFALEGIGLHTGLRCRAHIEAGEPGSGVVLLAGDERIKATIDNVCKSSARNTRIGRIQTVEHLFAALAMFGEVDVRIVVDGPEIPILDGSSAPWANALSKMGGRIGPRFFDMERDVSVELDGSLASIRSIGPNLEPCIRVRIDFERDELGAQEIAFFPLNGDFVEKVAPARTFAFESDVDCILGSGLARGGNLDNALVIGRNGPLNLEGLRFADEPVRHKLLDAIGDLFLLGGLPFADVSLVKPGHRVLHELARKAAPFVVLRERERSVRRSDSPR
jgi:UDP-3-O-[3-hydroxymyristoyl] N-acetylglucosamine deacetylase